ncbi:ABC transporter ATP-binding protein [Rothia halotolerans]|uniref:ABC transporter ATP-binding protein n=1 Tax=Rothia halotolerans TaxID=405770 RepID=UPI001873F926
MMSAAPAATSTTAAEVDFRGVGKAFPAARGGGSEPVRVLEDVTFTARPGEIVAVVGPSGCGKSTLLRAAAGLGRATTGGVGIDGSPVRGIDPRCAVAFQEPRLLPWRSVSANVSLGLPRGLPRAAGRQRVSELLELVGLAGHAGHRPAEISGGMAQRASLARALARNPRVLLLDEPFGALDALTRLRMQDLLLDIHVQDPTTVLLVTHDVEEALYLSDRVVVLGRPEGTGPAGIAEILDVDLPRPRSREDAALARMRGHLLGLLGVER